MVQGLPQPMNTVQLAFDENGQHRADWPKPSRLGSFGRTLVWFADQPTVAGYNPLLEMFWDPGIWSTPAHDRVVLVLSWLVTTLFCHFILFAFQRVLQRNSTS